MSLRVPLWRYSQARPTVDDVEVVWMMISISMAVLFVGRDQGGPHMKVMSSEHVRRNMIAVARKIVRVTATHMTHRLASDV